MEKELKIDGKTFTKKCRSCPAMLRFNWIKNEKQNEVTVNCAETVACELLQEVSR